MIIIEDQIRQWLQQAELIAGLAHWMTGLPPVADCTGAPIKHAANSLIIGNSHTTDRLKLPRPAIAPYLRPCRQSLDLPREVEALAGLCLLRDSAPPPVGCRLL